jgi:hypothetical protein
MDPQLKRRFSKLLIETNKARAIFTFHADAKETAQKHIARLYLFLQKGLMKAQLAKYFAPEELEEDKNWCGKSKEREWYLKTT